MFRIRMIQTVTLAAGMLLIAGTFAQAPADAPAGTTGLCKDGTYSSAASKRGACSGHKGVQTWYAASSSAAAAAPTTPAATSTAPAAPAAPAPTAVAPKVSAPAPTAVAAPGGGPGLVWVNTSTKVYHCQGDRYYGKTKSGSYMSEADAKAGGNRPDHGKPCS